MDLDRGIKIERVCVIVALMQANVILLSDILGSNPCANFRIVWDEI